MKDEPDVKDKVFNWHLEGDDIYFINGMFGMMGDIMKAAMEHDQNLLKDTMQNFLNVSQDKRTAMLALKFEKQFHEQGCCVDPDCLYPGKDKKRMVN